MNLPNDNLQANAFVDGELDLASQLAMEDRLRSDDAMSKRVDALKQVRDVVRDNGDYHEAPAALRARLAAMTSVASHNTDTHTGNPDVRSATTSASRSGRSIAGRLHGWFGWRGLATSMSVIALLAVSYDLVSLQSSNSEASSAHLMDDVVASHVRSTLGEHLVDVASSDHHTVKPFLSARLGYSPPVDELAVAGSTFLGGRVDYLDGKPVAALVYRQGQHIVNSFVWPSTSGDNSSRPAFGKSRGFLTAHWVHAGMTHWVISDVNGEEFQTVVRAIQLAEAAP